MALAGHDCHLLKKRNECDKVHKSGVIGLFGRRRIVYILNRWFLLKQKEIHYHAQPNLVQGISLQSLTVDSVNLTGSAFKSINRNSVPGKLCDRLSPIAWLYHHICMYPEAYHWPIDSIE